MSTNTTIEKSIITRCEYFEQAFLEKRFNDLVKDYYVAEPLIIGDGVGEFRGSDSAEQYFSEAAKNFRAVKFGTKEISETANGYLETGQVTLFPHDKSQSPAILDYFVAWRRASDGEWRAALDYFTPATVNGGEG